MSVRRQVGRQCTRPIELVVCSTENMLFAPLQFETFLCSVCLDQFTFTTMSSDHSCRLSEGPVASCCAIIILMDRM